MTYDVFVNVGTGWRRHSFKTVAGLHRFLARLDPSTDIDYSPEALAVLRGEE